MKYNGIKNNSQNYQGTISNKSGLMGSSKGLNFSMGADFKEKFNTIHG